jgi:hypothetical protein
VNDPVARARSAARANALLDDVEKLLRGGHKIRAIKAYRTATGCGLKEAKDTLDAIERAMGLPLPAGPTWFERLVRKIDGWWSRRGN